jgi:hypothetical protein
MRWKLNQNQIDGQKNSIRGDLNVMDIPQDVVLNSNGIAVLPLWETNQDYLFGSCKIYGRSLVASNLGWLARYD